jgi:hypothetical protein
VLLLDDYSPALSPLATHFPPDNLVPYLSSFPFAY